MNHLFKSILFISVLLTLFNNVSAQKVTEQDYYEFYNSILTSDSSGKILLIKQPGFYNLKSLFNQDTTNLEGFLNHKFWKNNIDTIFKQEDIKSMEKQILRDTNFRWSEKKLKKKVRVIDANVLVNKYKINTDSGWSSFSKKYGGFSTFSIPLFSIDKSICIIYQSEICGRACGSGYLFVYVRRKGKWVLYRSYNMWIS